VKGRREAKVVDLRMLEADLGEPEGFIFNIIESRASSSDTSKRRGASWLERRGAGWWKFSSISTWNRLTLRRG
ncbi:MAG: hypothetical protein AB7F89_07230, partial [Pirellulaceae bacterium]